MATIHVEISSNASAKNCWKLLQDYKNIDFFNPFVKNSFLLDESQETGVGALRQCDFTDGKNFIKERIIDWQVGKSFTVDIYESTMPVDKLHSSLGITPSPFGTQFYMHVEYTPKWGILGAILNQIAMKGQFKKMANGVPKGLEEKAAIADASAAETAT